MSLSLPLAVEKTLFRLALQSEGVVPVARIFLELPLSLEEVEEYADKVADGTSVLKNEWSEFLTYQFPELMDSAPPAPDGCPTCGGDQPPVTTEGGVEVRRPLLCESCYRAVRTLSQSEEDPGYLERLYSIFAGKGEAEDDPVEIARLEHEIFYLALQLPSGQFTHTTLAVQSRHPSTKLKERLDKMAARRYIHLGLLPSGDTVGYSFPAGLTYPKSHYDRVLQGSSETRGARLDRRGRRRPSSSSGSPEPSIRASIKRKEPTSSPLNIKIKERRDRGSR